MGLAKEFFVWKQEMNRAGQEKRCELLATLEKRLPPELGKWWQEKGISWIQQILNNEKPAIWFSYLKKNELPLYSFASLEDARKKLGLLKRAWGGIFIVQVFDVNQGTEAGLSLQVM